MHPGRVYQIYRFILGFSIVGYSRYIKVSQSVKKTSAGIVTLCNTMNPLTILSACLIKDIVLLLFDRCKHE